MTDQGLITHTNRSTLRITPHLYSWSTSLLWSIWTKGLILGSIFHLLLPDYEQVGWGWSQTGGALCLLGLFFVPSVCQRQNPSFQWSIWKKWSPFFPLFPLGFALFKLNVILRYRDVLTQSLLLLCFHLICAYGFWKPHHQRVCLRGVQSLTALTYFWAVIHKLNTLFLNQAESCALHGIEVIADAFPLLYSVEAILRISTWPLHIQIWSSASCVLIVEGLLAYGCWKSRPWIWYVGLFFHLPLTLTLAPAFGSVMLIGYGAIIPLSWIKISKRVSTKVLFIYGISLGITFLGIGLSYDLRWTILKAVKVILFMGLSGWVLVITWPFKYRSIRNRVYTSMKTPWIIKGIIGFYALHGASPYLGVEMQHSAAMLSNLRVDTPCENHLFLPTLKPLPYLYIHQARFANPTQKHHKRVRILKESIWNLTALHQMQKNWCIPHQRPIQITLSFDPIPQEPMLFKIDDLCTPDALDEIRQAHGIGGQLWLSGWQRLQKNMKRQCNQACIH